MDQKTANVGVASLPDPQERGLATGCSLPGNQAQPRRQFSPFAKHSRVADSCDKRGCGERSDARYADEALAIIALPSGQRDLACVVDDLRINRDPMLAQLRYELSHTMGESVGGVFEYERKAGA